MRKNDIIVCIFHEKTIIQKGKRKKNATNRMKPVVDDTGKPGMTKRSDASNLKPSRHSLFTFGRKGKITIIRASEQRRRSPHSPIPRRYETREHTPRSPAHFCSDGSHYRLQTGTPRLPADHIILFQLRLLANLLLK